MPNRYLTGIQKIVLQAGHGGSDPGAVANNSTENKETNQIVLRLARILRYNNLNVVIDPDLNLANAVSYVNRNYKFGQDWLLEIHKDSANADPNQLRNRMGIYYYGGDLDSQNIAQNMIQAMKNNGASSTSWARPDTISRFGRLGWIRDTIPLAHLIECGFMQDDISDGADEKYAKWVAQAICNVLEKSFIYDLDQPKPAQPSTPVNNSVVTRPDPWLNIANFESLPNANYYKDSFRNDDWGRILTDIKDRDLEVDYWKAQEIQNSLRITDLQNQIKNLENKIQNSPPPSTSSSLISYLNGYDYANLPFDITQAVTNNNLTYILERFKGLNSNYTNLYNQNKELKIQAEQIRDRAQTLVSSF